MKLNIQNLTSRIQGDPLSKYQIDLSKSEFAHLLSYVEELEKGLNKEKIKEILYNFRDMYCAGIDLSLIDDYIEDAVNKKEFENRFNIDFFEFAFLVEACIPPRPIARSMFWDKVIDVYYYRLTKDERARLYEWINKNWTFEKSLKEGEEGCLLFNARYNPENQYLVETEYEGKQETYECFLYNDRYYTNKNTSIQEQYIKNVSKKH